uniref:ER membrane protein complex subunit 6 n=1 Tax=Anopheles culicifacies TaxID=139723 RepID=A0A182M1N6_9DIPT
MPNGCKSFNESMLEDGRVEYLIRPSAVSRWSPPDTAPLNRVLGLTGVLGFLFYVLAVLCLWQMLLLKSGSNWQKYFISRKSLLTHGFLSGLCTYVLFWTFLYGMVHVY